MNNLKKLHQALIDLDKKMQELDEMVRNVRIEIQNVLWDLLELKQQGKKVSTK